MILNCHKKKFFIQSLEGEIIEVKGIRSSDSTHIISLVRANKLFNQGCEVYVAYVIDSNLDESQISKIHIICEYPNVFPKELLGLPPDHELEFAIEVYLGTTPISIIPYLWCQRAKRAENLIARSFGP